MHRYIYILLFCIQIPFTSLLAEGNDETFVIVLDAGHGGKDPGAIGSNRNNREKDINLSVVLEIGRLITEELKDVKVVYTRKTDTFVELGQRARIANKAKANLFISVHTNAIDRRSKRKPQGVQSYTLTLNTAESNLEVEKRENSVIQLEENGEEKWSYSNPKSSESDIMYELLQDQHMEQSVDFAQIVQREMVTTAKRTDAGVLQANFAVLRLTYMPSVLLELGYISTPSEEIFLMTNNGRKLLAKSIFNAIKKYKAQL